MFGPYILSFKYIYNSNLRYYLIAYLAIFTYSFVKVPFLTSIYTPAQLGTYAYYGSILSYIDILFLAWISSTAWRYVHDKKEVQSVSKLIATILPLLIILAIISFFCLYIFLFFFKQHSAFIDILTIGYFTILTQQLLSLYTLYLQSQNKINKWCAVIISQNLLSLATLLFLTLVLEKGIISIFLSSLLVNTCLIIRLVIKYRDKLKILIYNIDTKLYKKIISYSILIIISGLCFMIINNADRFIIDYYKGKSSVGVYSQTYSLAYVGLYSIIQVFSTIFLPIYNKNFAHSKNININRDIIKLYIIVFTPLLFFLLLHAPNITQMFLGESFEGHDNVFRIVLLSIYCFGFGNFFEIRLKFYNKIKIVTLVLIAVAILNVLLNIVLLKLYSIEVAAINTLISFATLTTCFMFLNLKFFLSVNLRKTMVNVFYASCLFFIFSYLSKGLLQSFSNFFQLIIYALGFFIIYTYCLKDDISVAKNTFREIL